MQINCNYIRIIFIIINRIEEEDDHRVCANLCTVQEWMRVQRCRLLLTQLPI